MPGENYSFMLAAGSAFAGSLTGVAWVGWWLAKQFNQIYRKMDEHEIKDVERFNALNLKIVETQIQAQTIEAIKHKI